MNETDYKTALIKQAKAEGYYARRIEDKFQVGFPDMVLKLRGAGTCFVEAKMVDGNFFEPTARQLIDLRMLHDPPFSFGVLVGIEPRSAGGSVVYYLSEPSDRVYIIDPLITKTNNFLGGLSAFTRRFSK